MAGKDFEKIKAKIIVRAWKDPKFKERLQKNPRAVFIEMGLKPPENIQIRVIEDKIGSYTFVLPPCVAQAEEMTEQQLEKVVGGVGVNLFETIQWMTCTC